MTRILVDCDGVMADFAPAYLNILHLITGRAHFYAEIVDCNFSKCGIATPAEDQAVWGHIRTTPGIVRGLDVLPDVVEALAKLRMLGQVVCVTSPQWGTTWGEERYHWLTDLGFTDKTIVYCSKKGFVQGDVLIDDALHHLADWRLENHRGFGICVDQPWNRHSTQHPRFLGLAGAAEYLAALRATGCF